MPEHANIVMPALKRSQYKVVRGQYYGTPKELWGFRTRENRRHDPTEIALAFLKANRSNLGLGADLEGIVVRNVIGSVGAFHVICEQRHLDKQVHRAYVTVHMDRRGRVYLCKNRAAPHKFLPKKFDPQIGVEEAARRARLALPGPRGYARQLDAGRLLWFPRGKNLIPSWRIRFARRCPPEEWIFYVSARTGSILGKYDNLSFRRGKARVFDPSPVTALGDHRDLITPSLKELRPPRRAYREVKLEGLDASGFLDGVHITTGQTRERMRSRTGEFRRLNHEQGFEEAMVYYHVHRAIDYLEELGYRGASRIFKKPIAADVNGTRADNSSYSPNDRLLTFGTGFINDAQDAETILHELGHAIQDAIVPDFGQSNEAAAMGEGFGDYFAGSFFASRKPRRYQNVVMTWDGLLIGLDDGANPPALRRLDSPLTFDDFRQRGGEHENGEIWSATLWSIRKAVANSDVANRLIIESHFQLDGFTTFARGARAILDADQNLYHGKYRAKLRRIFNRRKIKPI